MRGSSSSRQQSAGLGAMFEPPVDIMFRGNFEEGLNEAQKRNLWLVCPLNHIHLLSSSFLLSEFLVLLPQYESLQLLNSCFWVMDKSHLTCRTLLQRFVTSCQSLADRPLWHLRSAERDGRLRLRLLPAVGKCPIQSGVCFTSVESRYLVRRNSQSNTQW